MKKIFNPKSIALIGASKEEKSVGWGLAKNLLEGEDLRKVFFVNPFQKEILGKECYTKIGEIKEKIDLAIVAVPTKIIKEIIKECCDKKVGAIIVVSSGFGELGSEGKKLEEEMVAMVREAKIPLIGPNCLGIINPKISLNASFAPITPKAGGIAFLSQSGSLLDSIVDKNEIGFSKVVSYGNEADLGLCDFVEYLKDDPETNVIAIYLEGMKQGRRFMELAKEVVKVKPIVAIKSGRSEKGKEAAGTHTGSLAGDYKVFETAMKQSGVIVADSLEELLDISKALSFLPRCADGVGIVTNGGGIGVLAVDYCFDNGITVAELGKETLASLEKSKALSKVISKANPLDVIGDALSDRFEAGIGAMLKQKDINALIVISTPQIMTEHDNNAKIIVEMRDKYPLKPIVACFIGGSQVSSAIQYLEENGVPNYPDPKRAVKSIKGLIKQ